MQLIAHISTTATARMNRAETGMVGIENKLTPHNYSLNSNTTASEALIHKARYGSRRRTVACLFA